MRKKEVKFKLPLTLLLIRLLIISCTHNKQPVITANMDHSDSILNQLTVYDLKKLPEKSTLKLSEIGAIEIEYIPLETTPQNMIDHLNNIIFSKNYLLAREASKINMYRYDGQFITKVGTVGKGPNEFIAAAAVDVNPQDESIYIADALQPKFLAYDKNGKLIRTFKSPVKGTITFKYVEDGILCYYNNHSGNISLYHILFPFLVQ